MILGLSRRHFLNGEGLKESDPILCTDMPLLWWWWWDLPPANVDGSNYEKFVNWNPDGTRVDTTTTIQKLIFHKEWCRVSC